MLLALLAGLGAVGLAPALINLSDTWINDPLRSIGGLIVTASIVLTLRVWRRTGWELQGTWWGMLPVAFAYFASASRMKLALFLVLGHIRFNLLPAKLSLYCFASGFVLLFAGTRVWRKAWFPLALMLFAQPVPLICNRYLDLPLQSLSAQVARAFAVHIGFAPTDPQLLRLMFTPDFGMFIAPGCDGMRGAVTMGYTALIVGYLKRVSLPRWASYVAGAIVLGYLFNLMRLCALVLYYRAAVGHPALENFAKQADYLIGGSLILLAALLLVWVWTRQGLSAAPGAAPATTAALPAAPAPASLKWKIAGFAVLGVMALGPGVLALEHYQKSFAASVNDGDFPRAQLDAMMPRQLGAYKLARTWQEEEEGRVKVESAAYSSRTGDEIVFGVWLPPTQHTMHDSWRARGQLPELRSDLTLITANGRAVPFDAAFYTDGITDSFAGNAFCTPADCVLTRRNESLHIDLAVNPLDFNTRGTRAVSMFFRIDAPHSEAAPDLARRQLAVEAEDFVRGIDFTALSRKFQ